MKLFKTNRDFSGEQEIVLSEKNKKLRMFLAITCLIVGMGSIGYGLMQMLSKDSGWREITVDHTQEVNCSEDFVFLYNLGASGISATAEYKAISKIYSEATEKAFMLFTSDLEYENLNNIFYINQHPNEALEVDPVLYHAFELIQTYENRNIYLGPIYDNYENLFYITDDSELVYYDALASVEVAEYYSKIASFANDSEQIELELLGDNNIRLAVSEEYLNFAEENGIDTFLDFSWMRNAFVIDYLAETMISNGYKLGTISSYDGYSRNLDESDTKYSFNVFDKKDDSIYQPAVMEYSGQQSIVNLRAFVMNDMDVAHYYKMSNGEVRTSYLDVMDGVSKTSLEMIVSYSDEMGCADILINLIPGYIADEFDSTLIEDMNYFYCKDQTIYYNDDSLVLKNLGYATILVD